MVTIIDYGIGNLRSIEKAFTAVGVDVLRTDRPEDLASAERLVLPGVGAFGACADEIRRRGLETPILDAVGRGTPLLGVCVGMQLLFEESEEQGVHRGLGLLPGRVVRFAGATAGAAVASGETPPDPTAARPGAGLKVPHMGWNTVRATRPSPLLDGIPDAAHFYFVHSYHADAAQREDVLGTADYGGAFPAVVQRNRVYGVQFHPEKSQQCGLRILRNYSRL